MTATLGAATIDEIVAALDTARATKRQIRQITLDHPEMTVDDAYAVQRRWVERRLASGRSHAGHKIGLTSRAMQLSVGIDEPDFGALLDDMVYHPDAEIPIDHFIEPRVEVELAFFLRRPLAGSDVTTEQVIAATDHVRPAVEIIDSRIQRVDPDTGRTRTVRDTIADNAANAGVITGGRRILPRKIDLRWVGGVLMHNGVIEETGLGAGVLGNPAHAIAWLAAKYARYGMTLEPGQIILAGSFTRAVLVAAGDEVAVDFGDHGCLEFSFR